MPGGGAMVVLFFKLDFAADGDGADPGGVGVLLLLKGVGGTSRNRGEDAEAACNRS